MTVPPGFSVQLFAGEPDVKQPVAFAMDDRGRLWVAENYSYPRRQPEGEGRDRILIFEDVDGDGTFDRRSIFIEGLNLVTALEIGFGGVWVGAAPHLLFIPWSQATDKPAGPPQVVLDGWGYQDTHNTLSTFVWGPDGWLYGGHGVASHSRVGPPGAADDERQRLDGGVWRYHPTRKVFEVFAEGHTNPWGLDFNDHGHLFVTGCVIPHLWHVIQGGYYQRLFGQHKNPHTYEDLKTIADHRHWAGENSHAGREGYRDEKGELRTFPADYDVGGGHAHAGGMIYLGGSWPAAYRNRIFMNNLHGHRLNVDVIERKGSGYLGRHAPDFLFTRDRWSLILNLQYGPDGSVFMIDFYEKNLCHNPNPGLYDRSNGRLYKITYDQHGPRREPVGDLQELTDSQLAALQLHENDWYVRHARRILQERAQRGGLSPEARKRLREILNNPDVTRQLRALWALHATDSSSETDLLDCLGRSEHLRAWAIQLLAEQKTVSGPALGKFRSLARSDPSPMVRLYLAAAVQRLPLAQRPEILVELLSHAEDAHDHNLPLMYWYATEPVVGADQAVALDLLRRAEIPLVRKFIARRMMFGSQALCAKKKVADDSLPLASSLRRERL